MADEPIKHDKIIEPKVFQPAADSADVLLEKLSLLIGGFRELAKITGAKINSGIDPKSIADVDKLAEAQRKLASIEKGLTDVERVQAEVMIKTRKARQDLNDQLRSQGGLLGDLIIKKKQLGLDLLSAKTAGEIKNINQELFKTNGQIKQIKEGGVQSFNSWGNALQSFQFKFNALGSTIGNVIGNFISGGFSSAIGLIAKGITLAAGALMEYVTGEEAARVEMEKTTKSLEKQTEGFRGLTTSIKNFFSFRKNILDASDATDKEKLSEGLKEINELTQNATETQNSLVQEAEINNQKIKDESDDEEKAKLIAHGEDLQKQWVEQENVKTDLIRQGIVLNAQFAKKERDDKKEADKKAAEDKKKRDQEKLDAEKKALEEAVRLRTEAEKNITEEEKKRRDTENDLLNQALADANKEALEKQRLQKVQDDLAEEALKKKKEQADREAAIRENLTDTLFAISKKHLGDSEADKKKRAQIERLEQIVELTNLFYKAYASYLKTDKSNVALRKASQDILGAKAFGQFIAGSFKEGTEDTGGAGNVDADGGKLAIIHPNERILTKEQNQALGGITNEDLVSRFNMFPKVPIMDESRSNTVAKAMLSLLDTRLQSLQKTIKDQERWNFERNAAEEMVLLNQRMGILNKTTFKNPSPSYSKH